MTCQLHTQESLEAAKIEVLEKDAQKEIYCEHLATSFRNHILNLIGTMGIREATYFLIDDSFQSTIDLLDYQSESFTYNITAINAAYKVALKKLGILK